MKKVRDLSESKSTKSKLAVSKVQLNQIFLNNVSRKQCPNLICKGMWQHQILKLKCRPKRGRKWKRSSKQILLTTSRILGRVILGRVRKRLKTKIELRWDNCFITHEKFLTRRLTLEEEVGGKISAEITESVSKEMKNEFFASNWLPKTTFPLLLRDFSTLH